jgi:hypothetical protein
MANVLGELFQNIADAIRSKTGSTDTLKPNQFPEAIEGITGGGGGGGGGGGDEVAGLDVVSYMVHMNQTKANDTAIATVDVPANSIIHNVLGYTAGVSNSKAYVCPSSFPMMENPSGVTLTETDDCKKYTLSYTYGSSNYYNTIIAELMVSHRIPGLYKRTDGSDTVLCSDSSVTYLPNAQTTYGDFTKADFSATPIAIGDRFAYQKKDLKSVIVNSNCPSIGKQAFYQSTVELVSDNESDAIGTVSLPNATSIKDSAFYECTNITDVSLPNVTSLGIQVFQKCSGLKTVSIPKVEYLDRTFRYCSALESIVLESVIRISTSAFASCTALREVICKSNVEYFDSGCFYGCTNLALLDLSHCTAVPYTSPSSGYTYGADFEIRVPAALYDEWVAHSSWSGFADRIVAV